jgi:hypothetical protein
MYLTLFHRPLQVKNFFLNYFSLRFFKLALDYIGLFLEHTKKKYKEKEALRLRALKKRKKEKYLEKGGGGKRI